MVPRPAHIQGQLRQGIESLDPRRRETVYRVAARGVCAHGSSFNISARCSCSYIIVMLLSKSLSPHLPLNLPHPAVLYLAGNRIAFSLPGLITIGSGSVCRGARRNANL